MVRLKHNGQIFIFNSDSRWPLTQEDLVGICHWKQGKTAPDNLSVLLLSKTEDYNLARTCCKI